MKPSNSGVVSAACLFVMCANMTSASVTWCVVCIDESSVSGQMHGDHHGV